MTLRDAWTTTVTPDDYEAHMTATGQAQANAALVRDLVSGAAIPTGARFLIAGAGTGQMFDYISREVFAPYRLLCTDLNAEFLRRLAERLECATLVDDVEDSRLDPGFASILLVLVLEHVDFRKALASMARLAPEQLLIVIQENPQAMASAVTPGRIPPGSMRVFAETTKPHLVAFSELTEELSGHGFRLKLRRDVPVADGKKMIGVVFGRA